MQDQKDFRDQQQHHRNGKQLQENLMEENKEIWFRDQGFTGYFRKKITVMMMKCYKERFREGNLVQEFKFHYVRNSRSA